MAITFQHNSNNVIAVYYTYTVRDESTGKSKTKRKYIGTMRGDVFVPSTGKRGPSVRDITEPIEINSELTTEVENLYLKAELNRMRKLLEQIVGLIQPTLEKEVLLEEHKELEEPDEYKR